MDDAISTIELEAMLAGRHLTALTRRGGQLDRSAYVLLSCLEAGGSMSIAELSATLGSDVSTINRQTAALRAARLAERIPDPDGGLHRELRITPEGIRRLADERIANREALERLLADWTAEDREVFAAALHRFNVDIERRSGRPWPRE